MLTRLKIRAWSILLGTMAAACPASEGVILLHGLCRTERSMAKMQSALVAEGYIVLNVAYPSRQATIEELSETTIDAALTHPKLAAAGTIHFVTHSMGGILVRHYLEGSKTNRIGRMVMLGAPNQGSELVEELGDWELVAMVLGPGGLQLGTDAESVPSRLGPVELEVGVIAGDRSINWINSLIIDGPDDGKVSVATTRVEGMKDHVVIHATHPFIMRDKAAIRETIHFLRAGEFSSGSGDGIW
jgi:hypothetical protein